MSNAPRNVPTVPAEQARDARARAWAFAFSCHAKKKGARLGAPDARKESNGSGKVSISN